MKAEPIKQIYANTQFHRGSDVQHDKSGKEPQGLRGCCCFDCCLYGALEELRDVFYIHNDCNKEANFARQRNDNWMSHYSCHNERAGLLQSPLYVAQHLYVLDNRKRGHSLIFSSWKETYRKYFRNARKQRFQFLNLSFFYH